ncbi:MAG: bifunctional SulP family inorganic anion transporter/carbonic anhydrase [Myxococcales bacterium]|nr:MAG: bifunctional SulP family inorganic anion transporter/carbonic anhydrase [Myxococcales bacterium]
MPSNAISLKHLGKDATAGLVVYLVALPLCLGIALASDAPLAAGLISGILGGLVVGSLSASHTSVSGPAAGLAAVVAAQIAQFGSFSAFLVAVVLAGVIQVALGLARAGFIASFFPSSVIKGLLAGIGVILLLKQLPHVLGHDADVEGEMAFLQPDGENSITELLAAFFDIQPGAALIGVCSVILLLLWDRIRLLKKSPIPGPLVVVLLGVGVNWLLKLLGSQWVIDGEHLVQVPVGQKGEIFSQLLVFPDWSVLVNPAIYFAAFTLALVASLETLLNLDAVDELDPKQRHSPPNRELIAQGIGNVFTGLIGGIPMTSVIVRSSVNIDSGNKTKLSAIFHGVLLLISVLVFPHLLNSIPLAALAAILLVTGLKLASPALFRKMWVEGKQQFLPFAATVVFIVLTDLLTGVLIGLAVAIAFILRSNFRRPLRLFKEKHIGGEVLRIELASQVSFLNRASLEKALRSVAQGGNVLIDARKTEYIDPDILDLIYEFRAKTAPAHDVTLSLLGFKDEYKQLDDRIEFVDYSTQELQAALDSDAVLDILKEGNARMCRGERLTRDLKRQISGTASGQAPLAVILSCIDSRTPAEHVFDLGIGDIFSVRIAGNIAREKVLASIEYGCKVAGAKLIVVMGHTSCGAVTAAVNFKLANERASEETGCEHLDVLTDEIQKAMPLVSSEVVGDDPLRKQGYIDEVARANVVQTIDVIRKSTTIDALLREGAVHIVGAMYDVSKGNVKFI